MSLQMQSQHQMVKQIIVIANAEPTSNGHAKSLALHMQSQHQMVKQTYCHCKCRAREKKKSNWTVENILKLP